MSGYHDGPESESQRGTKSFFGRITIDRSKVIGDAVLGLSDGITVPFALTAGLASIASTRIVILGGVAELFAGAISMGLGGYFGAQSELEEYNAKERECIRLIERDPQKAAEIIDDHFQQYNLCLSKRKHIVACLVNTEVEIRKFIVHHYYGVEKPDPSRAFISALTIAFSYLFGGFLPLSPYIMVPKSDVKLALYLSIGIMVLVLLVFGYVKTCIIRGWKGTDNIVAGFWGAGQMFALGACAVGAAVGLVRAIAHAE